MKILVLHGPNINMLGVHVSSLHDTTTLEDLNSQLTAYGKKHDLQVSTFQSDHEEVLINTLQNSDQTTDYIIFNPVTLTHTNMALLDALCAVNIPFIEVHTTPIAQRKPIQQQAYLSPYAIGSITGLGIHGYFIALDACKHIQHTTNNEETIR